MQAASNWFLDAERRLGMKRYKPTDFGMPQYVDDFCSARQGGCQMPAVNIAGYQGFGGNVGLYPEVLNIQGQVNVTHVKGRAHAASSARTTAATAARSRTSATRLAW